MAHRAVLRRLSLTAGRTCLVKGKLPFSRLSAYRSILQSQSQASTVQLSQIRCQSNIQTPVINIQDDADFKTRVIESEKPVVVDFHASWCGPCRLLGPRLESIVSSKEGKVILAKVDIDELGDLAMFYGVQAVPTVIAVKNGKKTDTFVGLQDDDQIETFVEKLL